MFKAILTLLLISLLPSAGQGTHDIYVTDKVAVQRAVLSGPSARMIAVGHPGGFNYVFDATFCSPSYAWFGGFLDFKSEATGRGGKVCRILGVQRPLVSEVIPLRLGDPQASPKSLKFRGYRRDKAGAPTFLLEVNGTPVEQELSSPKPETIVLTLKFPKGHPSPAYYHLNQTPHAKVVLGKNLRWNEPGIVEIPTGTDSATITIELKPTKQVFKRKVPKLTGAQLFQNYCATCHSIDGSKLIGPTFKALAGRQQTVTRDGKTETITTDGDYLLESILKPQAAIVKGYENIPMADFSSVLSEKQIAVLVKYLQSLK